MKGYTKNIDWIDGLKGFAIIAILLNHFAISFEMGPWFSNPFNNWPDFSVRMATIFPKTGIITFRIIKFLGWLGDMGPGVFFILSGLTLMMSSLSKPLKPFDFYRKRLLRIYPLYIFIHLIIVVVAIYWFKWKIHFFSAATFYSFLGLRFKDSLFFYINPSWWFIWVIIQMYLLFPFLVILLKKKGIPTFLALTFLITIVSRLLGILGVTYSGNLYYWMTGLFAGTRLFEFTFGMYLGYLLFNNNPSLAKFLSGRFKVLMYSFCIYALGFIFSWTYIGSIFSNILISIGLSGLFYSFYEIFFKDNNYIKRSLLWIGKNSFSVFLLHQPFLEYFSPLFKGVQKGFVLIIIIFLSFIAGHFIEKFIILSIKYIQSRKADIRNFLNRTLIIGLMVFICFSVYSKRALF